MADTFVCRLVCKTQPAGNQQKNITGLFKRVTSKKAAKFEAAIQKSPAQKESNNTTSTTTLTTTSTTTSTTTYTDGDAPTYANTNEVL